jgi:hypothetical protein
MSQLQNLRKRPEGPELNRPDRKVGIRLRLAMSAEGAAQRQVYAYHKILELIYMCRSFGAPCIY